MADRDIKSELSRGHEGLAAARMFLRKKRGADFVGPGLDLAIIHHCKF